MGRVMLVDDEAIIRGLYAEMLSVGGHELVATANDGTEAVEKFDQMLSPPDLVLMDHRMPRKTGLEATREIIGAHPGTKILIVTADFSVLAKVEAEGAWGFLEKPFSMERLLSTIAAVLSGSSFESLT